MKEKENWEIRRQVQETDLVYQEAREQYKAAHRSNAFASAGVRQYEMNMGDYGKAIEQIKGLKSEMENNIGDKDNEKAQILSSRIEANTKFAEEMIEKRGEFLRGSFKELMKNALILMMQEGYDSRKKYILEEFNKLFNISEIQKEFKNNFGNNFSEATAANFWIKFEKGLISDEFLYAMAKRHEEDIKEQKMQLDKIVGETKVDFKTAVLEAVKKGFLPEITKEVLPRIDSVAVDLSDRFNSIQLSTMGSNDKFGIISVSNEQLQENLIPRLKKILYHEFLHELSGKSIVVETRIDDSPNQVNHFFHEKSGVALNKPDLEYSPNRWINEAITEWLAIKLSGYNGNTLENSYNGSNSYVIERQELDRLFSLGLEESSVTNAYFENFLSDQLNENKGQYFVELIKKINDIEGEAGFIRLENKHIMHEVEFEMYNKYVHPVEDNFVKKEDSSDETKIFNITISIGTTEQNTITKKFVYIAQPSISENISIGDQWDQVEKILDYIEKKFNRRVRYEVT